MPGTTLLGTLVVALGSDSKDFTRGLEAAGIKTKKASDEMKRASVVAVGLSAAIAGVGLVATKLAAGFETQMIRVGAISKATAEEFKQLEDTAKRLGATTQFTATQAAEGMTFLAQAGFSVAENTGAMEGVLQLATAAQLDLATASDIAASTLRGMGLEVSDLGRVNDVLVTAMTSANTNVQQLGAAFKFVGPVAKSAGVAFEEIAAGVSLMSNAGIQGEMAGTAMRGAIAKLLNPSKEAAAVLAKLGITAVDSSGKLMPFSGIIRDLGASGITTGQIFEVFGQRAGPGIAALIEVGADALEGFTKKLKDSGGAAGEIQAKQLDSLEGQIDILKSQFESIALSIGQTLIPAMRGIIDAAQGVLQAFIDLPEPVKAVTVSLAAASSVALALAGSIFAAGVAIPAFTNGLKSLSVVSASTGLVLEILRKRIASVSAAAMASAASFKASAAELGRMSAAAGAAKIASKAMRLISAVALDAGFALALVVDALLVVGAASKAALVKFAVAAAPVAAAMAVIAFIIVGVGALISSLVVLWEEFGGVIKSSISDAIGQLMSKWDRAAAAISSVMDAVAVAVGAVFSALVDKVAKLLPSGVMDGLSAASVAFNRFIGDMRQTWGVFFDWLSSGIAKVFDWFVSGFKTVIKWLKTAGAFWAERFGFDTDQGGPSLPDKTAASKGDTKGTQARGAARPPSGVGKLGDAADETAEKLGVEFGEFFGVLADGKLEVEAFGDGFNGAMADIRSAVKSTNKGLVLVGRDIAKAMATEKIAEKIEEMGDSFGDAAGTVERGADGLAAPFTELASRLGSATVVGAAEAGIRQLRENSKTVAKTFGDAMGFAAAFIGDAFLQGSETLGTVFSAAVEGFEQGGVFGAIIGAFAALLSETKSFAAILGNVESFLQRVVSRLEPIVEPFVALFDAIIETLELVSIIGDAIGDLTGGFEVFAFIIEGLAKVVRFITRVIETIINGIIEGLAKAAGLFSEKLAKKIRNAKIDLDVKGGDKPDDSADDVISAFNEVDSAVLGFGDAVREATAELLNVPTGIKIAAERFAASDPSLVAGAGTMPGGGGVTGVGALTINIENFTSDNPADFLDTMRREGEFQRFRDTGSTMSGLQLGIAKAGTK